MLAEGSSFSPSATAENLFFEQIGDVLLDRLCEWVYVLFVLTTLP